MTSPPPSRPRSGSNPGPRSGGFGFEQGQVQEQRLEPRMLQSIQVLALPVGELDLWLREAAQENEALRLEEPLGVARSSASGEGKEGFLASVPDAKGGLFETLRAELSERDLDAHETAWAELVLRALDARGYLVASDEELLTTAAEEGLAGDAGDLGRAIGRVQSLEPRGVGGRDPVEALLLQLDPATPDYALLASLIEDFLDDVARNKLPAVARGLGVELDRLQELLGQLRGLTLEPAAGFSEEPAGDAPLVPDLVVEPDGDGFTVRLTSGNLPPVALDEDVAALARDRDQDEEVRRYLRDKVERARWIVDALALRERTLLRVATVALERQRAFLSRGPGHLVPLAMGEVAELLNVHLSTVSRAVAGKHVDTDWGIVPLRSFFQRKSGAGEERSTGATGGAQDEVQRELAALVADEDPAAPLSDAELTERLAASGVKLSRRSVANLRKALGIPSSYRRRRYS